MVFIPELRNILKTQILEKNHKISKKKEILGMNNFIFESYELDEEIRKKTEFEENDVF